jgi:hypothetical protein
MGLLANLLGKILGKGTPSPESTAVPGAQPPPTSDSAAMNVWLHQEVIKKISENGGKVPPELLKS